ncbi:p32 [Japanese holly fern mottle virus]|uniref:p32 n=1 Tax=Japanese holly fern mottle virus TaxID=659660 RepID=C7T4Z9_9VIRU|nr:p32 [Japanese holly fern mottle virus]
MSQVIKGSDLTALLSDLYGEVTHKELKSMGLGTLVRSVVDEPTAVTLLVPPKTRSLWKDLFSKDPVSRSTGYVYVPCVVRVFVPHVELGSPGFVTFHLSDSGLAGLVALRDQTVSVTLGEGPQIIAFYPSYSLPLCDSGTGQTKHGGRTFVIVSASTGASVASGNSAFSTFDLWTPQFSARTTSCVARPAQALRITVGRVKQAFNSVLTPSLYASAVMTAEHFSEGDSPVSENVSLSKVTSVRRNHHLYVRPPALPEDHGVFSESTSPRKPHKPDRGARRVSSRLDPGMSVLEVSESE